MVFIVCRFQFRGSKVIQRYVHFCNNMHSKMYSHLIFTELHRIIQHQGPLEEFKQLYSHLSHTKSSPRYVDSSSHALLFR